MQPPHWLAIALAVVGVALGRGRHPPTAGGFGAQAPTAHYPVGRTWRMTGVGLVLVALVLVIVASLT